MTKKFETRTKTNNFSILPNTECYLNTFCNNMKRKNCKPAWFEKTKDKYTIYYEGNSVPEDNDIKLLMKAIAPNEAIILRTVGWEETWKYVFADCIIITKDDYELSSSEYLGETIAKNMLQSPNYTAIFD